MGIRKTKALLLSILIFYWYTYPVTHRPIPQIVKVNFPENNREGNSLRIDVHIMDNIGLSNIKRVELHFKNTRGRSSKLEMSFSQTIDKENHIYEYEGCIHYSYVVGGTLLFYIVAYNIDGKAAYSPEIPISIHGIPIPRDPEPAPVRKKTYEESSENSFAKTLKVVGLASLILAGGTYLSSTDEEKYTDEERENFKKTSKTLLWIGLGSFAVGYIFDVKISYKKRMYFCVALSGKREREAIAIGVNYSF